MGFYMRSYLFFLGVSLSAISCSYAATDVKLDDGATNYPTIHAAIKSAVRGIHTLTLLKDTQVESEESDLKKLATLTVNGVPEGGTTVQSATGNTTSLFYTFSRCPLSLFLSDLTVSGFNSHNDPGGAIYAHGLLTLTATGPVTFSGNKNQNVGGAIYCVELNLTGTGPVTFSGNKNQNVGGAICSYSSLTLTDTQFSGNTATNEGGAAYMSIGNFTYTTTKDITLNPSDSLPAGMMGDNDIACHEVSSQFLKQGPSILVLNTNNPFWRGSTTVKEGRFIIGDRDHAGATWGSDTNRGAVTVDRNSLLG